MSSRINISIGTILFIDLMPQLAFAQSLHKIFGYLEIFIGLFLTASIIMFAGALLTYFTRYGTPRRAEVFPYMQWAIAIVFVLIVILAIVEFVQKHTTVALYVAAAILFFTFVIIFMYAMARPPEKKPGPPAHDVPPPTRR